MTGLEIALLIIGVIIFAGSFILSSKMDGSDESKSVELSEKQKKYVENQIQNIFDENIKKFKRETEIELDKLSDIKMNEMNEYSESILNEINRNHNETAKLYDKLSEKEKAVSAMVTETATTNTQPVEKPSGENHTKEEHKKNSQSPKKTAKTSNKSKKDRILDQLDAVARTVSDTVPADEEAQEEKPKRKTPTGKTAADRVRTAVKKETTRESNKDIKVFEDGNNSEKILELNSQGKSNVEIAKELGLGIGEVKLVIDLFRGDK